MSRAYEAKLEAIKAYPDDRQAAASLFHKMLDMGWSDIEYDLGMSIEKYLFGNEITQRDQSDE